MANTNALEYFDKKLSEAGAGKLVVVDFTAAWCGPCVTIGPKFDAMEGEFQDVLFIRVGVDEHPELVEREGVSAMPTFKFYKDGKQVDELMGADEEKLREMITKNKKFRTFNDFDNWWNMFLLMYFFVEHIPNSEHYG